MANENESLNSLKEEKTTLDEELKTLDSEADADRITEINERLNPLKDEILTASEDVNKQLFARAKKAEGFTLEDGKWIKKPEPEAKPKDPEPKENKPNDPQLSEELKLIARGLSDEDIEQAKIIAKGKEISLQEAIKDPLFVIYQQDAVEKQKKEDAKLGASKGSGVTEEKPKGTQSGATRDEHQEAFKEALGKN